MKLLVTGAFKLNNEQTRALSALGFDVIFVRDEREPLKMDVSDIEVVICNGLFLSNDINKFTRLKYIQLTSAGSDRVPLKMIESKNIKLETARGVYSTPMAEWVMLKILEIYKKSRNFYRYQSEHKWIKEREITELRGKTALVAGFGSVGQAVTALLKAFGVYVIALDIKDNASQNANEKYNEFLTTDNLSKGLQRSDIVILTIPLNDLTTKMFSSEELAIMKNDAVLINVSRGGVIDQEALVAELQKGKFRGVALDVFENEPLPEDSPLWGFENTLITPHNAFISDRNDERIFQLIYGNLQSFIAGKS